MLQCISDEEIEAVDSLFSVLQIGKVFKLGTELAPGLWESRWGKQCKCIHVLYTTHRANSMYRAICVCIVTVPPLLARSVSLAAYPPDSP